MGEEIVRICTGQNFGKKEWKELIAGRMSVPTSVTAGRVTIGGATIGGAANTAANTGVVTRPDFIQLPNIVTTILSPHILRQTSDPAALDRNYFLATYLAAGPSLHQQIGASVRVQQGSRGWNNGAGGGYLQGSATKSLAVMYREENARVVHGAVQGVVSSLTNTDNGNKKSTIEASRTGAGKKSRRISYYEAQALRYKLFRVLSTTTKKSPWTLSPSTALITPNGIGVGGVDIRPAVLRALLVHLGVFTRTVEEYYDNNAYDESAQKSSSITIPQSTIHTHHHSILAVARIVANVLEGKDTNTHSAARVLPMIPLIVSTCQAVARCAGVVARQEVEKLWGGEGGGVLVNDPMAVLLMERGRSDTTSRSGTTASAVGTPRRSFAVNQQNNSQDNTSYIHLLGRHRPDLGELRHAAERAAREVRGRMEERQEGRKMEGGNGNDGNSAATSNGSNNFLGGNGNGYNYNDDSIHHSSTTTADGLMSPPWQKKGKREWKWIDDIEGLTRGERDWLRDL